MRARPANNSAVIPPGRLPPIDCLPEQTLGIDAGLTLTKIAYADPHGVALYAHETARLGDPPVEGMPATGAATHAGATGARTALLPPRHYKVVSEIDAAARGVVALSAGSGDPPPDLLVALLGTGTAFIAVRDGRVAHLGGTALGGGSFAGIARRIAGRRPYDELVRAAARGDRRNADLMIRDAYDGGVGALVGELTAAHLARATEASLDDVLAALLNLHGESIAQIAASRARIAGLPRIVLAGGFVHDNGALITSITSMCRLFGLDVEVCPAPAFAGAVGAAALAAEQRP